jgi:tetratricopeptide (TPR) repeat protein
MAKCIAWEGQCVPEHLSRLDVEGFAAGALRREDRIRVMRHLLTGCPPCSRALGGLVGLVPVGKNTDAGYDVALARASARVFGKSVHSASVIATLSSVVSGQRSWKAFSAGEIAHLRGIPQVRALLEAGRSMRHHDPEGTLRLTSLARHAADRLTPQEFGWEAVADMRALTWGELANAHRICDQLSEAGKAMNRAIHWFRRGSCPPLMIARIADLMASLLGAQKRLAEGLEILWLTHQVYLGEGQAHLAGRVLIKASVLAASNAAPGKAIQLTRQGLELLDPQREPTLVAQALRNMVWFLCDLGQFRGARRALWHGRHLFVEHGNALDLLRVRWLEGRIYAGLSDFSRAERAFEETRSGFAAKGQIYPAALAGLDLAALWTRQGRVREVYELAEEMITTFRALGVAREAIAALVMLKHVCCIETGGRVLDVIQLVVRFLEELESQAPRRQSSGTRSSGRPSLGS